MLHPLKTLEISLFNCKDPWILAKTSEITELSFSSESTCNISVVGVVKDQKVNFMSLTPRDFGLPISKKCISFGADYGGISGEEQEP